MTGGSLDVPVLIVGGGPVGLSASLLLARHGARSLLVERHPGTSIHPKARGINVRTMEVFRQAGAEDAVRAATLDLFRGGFTLLAGPRGAPWVEAAHGVGRVHAVPLEAHTASLPGYGIDDDGAGLVRPDGLVAWRRRSAARDPRSELDGVFDQLLGRAAVGAGSA